MHSRTTSLFVLLPCLAAFSSACGDDNSIGADACLGSKTRCDVPALSEPETPPNWLELETSNLDTLAPALAHVLSFPSPYYAEQGGPAFGELAGSADGTLWHIRPSADGRAIEAHILDGDGSVLKTASISVDDALDANARDFIERDFGGPVDLRVGADSVRVVAQQGLAPVVQPYWRTCDTEGNERFGCYTWNGNLIAFQKDVRDAPLRLPLSNPRYDYAVLVSQATDGGIWTFRSESEVLEKFDASGALLLQQSAVHASFALSAAQWPTRVSSVTNLFATPNGGVGLISTGSSRDQSSQDELWLFDAAANPTYRAPIDDGGSPFAIGLSGTGYLTMFDTESRGDLLVRQFDVATTKPLKYNWLRREDYTSLGVQSLTRDAGGNVYVLTVTGGRSNRVPTLCSVALDGGVRCFLTPELTGNTIVGAEAGVVYAEVIPDIQAFLDASDTSPKEVVLQRFEVPLDAPTLRTYAPVAP